MICIAIATLLVGQAQASPVATLPVPMQEMIKHYQKTVWAQGRIVLTVTAAGEKTQVLTEFAYEKPSMLFIKQTKATGALKYVTSDGKTLSYDNPLDAELSGAKRLKERVDTGRKLLTVPELYKASSTSLFDRSTPLDLIMGHPEDVDFFAYQILNIEDISEKGASDGNTTFVGDFRHYGTASVSGRFRMVIGPKSDLLQYGIEEAYMAPNGAAIKTQFIWDVQADLDGKLDRTLFRVVY